MGVGKAPGEVAFELHHQVWWHWIGRMQRTPWCHHPCALFYSTKEYGLTPLPNQAIIARGQTKECSLGSPSGPVSVFGPELASRTQQNLLPLGRASMANRAPHLCSSSTQEERNVGRLLEV